MTTTPSEQRQPASRSRVTLLITLGVLVVLVILFFIFSSLYTDWLWFGQLGYRNVLTTQWIATTVMFFIGFLAMAVPVFVSIQAAFRLRPVYAKLNAQLDRYQQVIEPLRRLAMWGIPVVLGLFAGVAASARWQTALEWLNGAPSGKVDPQFHLDISFYLFALPFYQAVAAFASAVVLISAIAALATCYLYGALRLNGREVRISRSARVQLATTGAVYLALQAVSIWLDQYSTLSTQTSSTLFEGASYADVSAVIPGRQILAGAAAVVAILFVITAVVGRWRFPLIGTALLLVSGLLVGTVYPFIVQKFQVEPNVRTLEAPYIQRNIDATRDAYGVAGVKEESYSAKTDAEAGALRNDAETTADIRIIDPSLVSDAFAQLERIKQYYQFNQYLDVDRYTINGKTQDTVIAVRELNQKNTGASSWYNNTLVYTHGYGVVAAYGNQRSTEGLPVFLESGIPSKGELGKFEPRIYFGEDSPTYSIVGGAKGTNKVELDYPSGDETSNKNAQTTFTGNGGPKLDNVFKKLVYAIKFQSEQVFLSSGVNDDSQILYTRNPADRVRKVAPYLTLDTDPYPAVVDGKVQWIIDGYTTSEKYPYSAVKQLSSAITDTYTPAPQLAPLDNVNYIRNSVKATVDAYSGKVTLYAWDDKDPILKTWQKIFPSTVKPISAISSQLMSHVRYPADLFKVQREILGNYHVTDPSTFYSSTDAWTTPQDPVPAAGTSNLQPPYYLTMKLPGAKVPAFSLYSTYIPNSKGSGTSNILTGYLAANADAGSKAGTVSSRYGKLTLLSLPKQNSVPGPGIVQNNFNTDTDVANQLSLLRRGNTDVEQGNLLTVPVGGGLLYVQPVYVKSKGDTSYPVLRKILVAFGDKVAFEDTLDAALDSLFGGDSGASAGDGSVSPTPTPTPGTGTATPAPTTPSTGNSAALKAALGDVQTALTARATALKSGDLAAYATADAALVTALNKVFGLEQ